MSWGRTHKDRACSDENAAEGATWGRGCGVMAQTTDSD